MSEQHTRQTALDLLRDHAVIIAPTDTVYGIMCRYDSPQAVQRLFEVKQRPLNKAIPVLIGELDQLSLIAHTPLSPCAHALAERFWPGPLTLIVPARGGLPGALTAGGNTVGVRMPDHDGLRELMRVAGPLAATSANRSGEDEACSASQALDQLDGLASLILSDDDSALRLHRPRPSTIVDLAGAEAAVLRPGPIADEVRATLARHAPC